MSHPGRKLNFGIFGQYAREETCPGKHAPCPADYVGWSLWAEEMEKTHEQKQCPECGLWAVWEHRVDASASGQSSDQAGGGAEQ